MSNKSKLAYVKRIEEMRKMRRLLNVVSRYLIAAGKMFSKN